MSMGLRWLLASGMVLLAGLAVVWFSRDVVEPIEPVPPPASSPYQNTRSEALWIGNESCRECHADAFDSWLETSHSRALALLDPAQEPEGGTVVDEKTNRLYEIFKEGDEFRHRESIQTPDGEQLVLAEHAVDYVIGSGNFSRSYLVDVDGFLFESPVTWYARKEAWGLSPGYESYNSGFERPTEIRCIECHVGRVEPSDGAMHRLAIHDMTIGCERCHGPGSLHKEKHLAATLSDADRDAEHDFTIVHPGKLDRERSEAICAQCHLHSDATINVRGRTLADFRPGLQLTDFQVSFSLMQDDKPMEVVGHMEQMRLSACHIQTETLTCTTCHDPHQSLAPAEAVTWYRNRCLDCHGEESCGVEKPIRLVQQSDDNCVACHMPRVSTDIPHFAFTHHRIGIHAEEQSSSGGETRASEIQLIPVGDVSHLPAAERQRLEGLAFHELSEMAQDPDSGRKYARRAMRLLNDLKERGMSDSDVDAALSRMLLPSDRMRARELAAEVLEDALAEPDRRATALYIRGSTAFEEGRPDDARDLLRELTQIRHHGQVWHMLSVCELQRGDITAAREAAETAVRLSPQSVEALLQLARVYDRSGERNRALDVAKRAGQIEAAQPELGR